MLVVGTVEPQRVQELCCDQDLDSVGVLYKVGNI